MKKRQTLAHAILWATAILAAALTGAPLLLTTVLLPMLAVCALVLAVPRPRRSAS